MKNRIALTFLLTTFAFTQVTHAQFPSIRTVAVTGDEAPGAGAGVAFGEFNQGPLITADGTLIFETFLQGPGVNFGNLEAIFTVNAENEFNLIVRGGNDVPGVPGENFVFFDLPISGPGGQVFVQSLLPGGTDSVFLQEGNNALTLIGLEGQQVPGAPTGTEFATFNEFLNRVDASGGFTTLIGLQGNGVNSANNSAIARRPADSDFSIIAREGDAIPNAAPGTTFNSFFDLSSNANGQVAFTALQSGAGDSSESTLLLVDSNGEFQQIAVEGQQVPGAPAGITFQFLQNVRLNSAGQTVFTAALEDPNEPFFNFGGNAIVRSTNAELEVIARSGAAEGALSPGITFDFFLEGVVINDAGQVAFGGLINGTGVNETNDSVIVLEGLDGELGVVAREGDLAPGVDDGAVFDDFADAIPGFTLDFPGIFSLNAAGQVAFFANLTGSAIDDTNDKALFAIDGQGELQLIVREGDLFDVDDDPLTEDLRVIESIDFTAGSGGSDGFSIAFNDLGDLAFALEFTDGTEGVFVTSLPTLVPEPTGLVLLFTMVVSMVCGRSRHTAPPIV